MSTRQKDMKTLGVIGGMGPLVSSHFYKLLVQNTKADSDQDHPDILICGMSSIPDRSSYILGVSKESPLDKIIIAGRKLINMGAEIIAIPCVSSHFFYPDIVKLLPCPVINIVEITTKHLQNIYNKVAVLATLGTLKSGTLHNSFYEKGIEIISLSQNEENDIMSIIYSIKSNKKADIERFSSITSNLFNKGAQSIILACTELSILKYNLELDERFVDSLTILVEESLVQCGARVKNQN